MIIIGTSILQWLFYEKPVDHVTNSPIDEEEEKYSNEIISLFANIWRNLGGECIFFIGTILLLISSCIYKYNFLLFLIVIIVLHLSIISVVFMVIVLWSSFKQFRQIPMRLFTTIIAFLLVYQFFAVLGWPPFEIFNNFQLAISPSYQHFLSIGYVNSSYMFIDFTAFLLFEIARVKQIDERKKPVPTIIAHSENDYAYNRHQNFTNFVYFFFGISINGLNNVILIGMSLLYTNSDMLTAGFLILSFFYLYINK